MNNGREFIGLLVGLSLKYVDAPDVISTGAVSPMPRATPRISAVPRPERAVGSTTCHTVRHCEEPSAKLASRRPEGTTRKTTSLDRAMIGSMVIDKAMAAA